MSSLSATKVWLKVVQAIEDDETPDFAHDIASKHWVLVVIQALGGEHRHECLSFWVAVRVAFALVLVQAEKRLFRASETGGNHAMHFARKVIFADGGGVAFKEIGEISVVNLAQNDERTDKLVFQFDLVPVLAAIVDVVFSEQFHVCFFHFGG